MTIATTVCLPVIRGPVQAAKTLGALDVLSGGRLVIGISAGSSAHDYEAVGIPFEERLLRRRFGESYDRYRRSVPRWLPWPVTRGRSGPRLVD